MVWKRKLGLVLACMVVLAATALLVNRLVRQTAGTPKPAARTAYLKACFFLDKRTPDDLNRSLALFRHALSIEPRYAAAFAGMASCYSVMAANRQMPAEPAAAAAVDAARQAIALDPGIAEAHAALGLVSSAIFLDWGTADTEFRTALKLNPASVSAHRWFGLALLYQGRFPEAAAEMRKAQEIDPVSLIGSTSVGLVSLYARDYDAAIIQARKTLELDKGFRLAHLLLGSAYEQKQRWTDAEREYRLVAGASQEDMEGNARLAHLFAVSGRVNEAKRLLDQMLPAPTGAYTNEYQIAAIYAGLGERDQALRWLRKSVENHNALLMKVDPAFDNLRSSPEFAEMLRLGHVAN